MALTRQEIRQVAIDKVVESGQKASGGTRNYILLHRLAKAHGIEMNGARFRVAATCRVSDKVIEKTAVAILTKYATTGELTIPKEFQVRGRY